MKRREFIALLGGAAAPAFVPLIARAQQRPTKIPRIGIIDDGPIWEPFRAGVARDRLCRRTNHRFRISPRQRQSRAAFGSRSRSGASAGRCDHDLRHAGEPRRQGRHIDHPDRHDLGRRSGAGRPGAKPCASGRQHHRQHHSVARPRPETAATRQGDHPVGGARRAAVESRQRFQRGPPRADARRRAGPGPCVHRRRGAQRRRFRRRVRHLGARAARCRAADQRSDASQPNPADHRLPGRRTGCRECSRPGRTPRPAA